MRARIYCLKHDVDQGRGVCDSHALGTVCPVRVEADHVGSLLSRDGSRRGGATWHLLGVF
jgi:hypothetical protein